MRRPILALTMFGLLPALASCSSSTEPLEALELRAVPTLITVHGQPVELAAAAGRDLMPGYNPEGRRLAVAVRLPGHVTGVRVDRLWVVFGEEVWESAVRHSSRTNEWGAVGGPEWGPDVSVQVIARLRDQNGIRFFVRDAEVLITGSF